MIKFAFMAVVLAAPPFSILKPQNPNAIIKLADKADLDAQQLEQYQNSVSSRPKLTNVYVGRLQQVDLTKPITILVSPDLKIEIKDYLVRRNFNYTTVYYGDESADRMITLTFSDKVLVGHIHYGGKNYVIETLGGKFVLIAEVEP